MRIAEMHDALSTFEEQLSKLPLRTHSNPQSGLDPEFGVCAPETTRLERPISLTVSDACDRELELVVQHRFGAPPGGTYWM